MASAADKVAEDPWPGPWLQVKFIRNFSVPAGPQRNVGQRYTQSVSLSDRRCKLSQKSGCVPFFWNYNKGPPKASGVIPKMWYAPQKSGEKVTVDWQGR